MYNSNHGISYIDFAAWRVLNTGKQPSLRNLVEISIIEVKEFYANLYWNRMQCEQMFKGIDLLAFAFAIKYTPVRAAKLLQIVLLTPDDGYIGPITLKELSKRNNKKMIMRQYTKVVMDNLDTEEHDDDKDWIISVLRQSERDYFDDRKSRNQARIAQNSKREPERLHCP
jgi:lysozyme family protein